MLKQQNKKLTRTAVVLTLIFVIVSLFVLIGNEQDNRNTKYIGVKDTGSMIELHAANSAKESIAKN
ncbi:hypothetical protein [Cysteiniphilum marinum]|uniref:hypothetical protein n=1 Tax=Cysteiniphilum marinum TaxID=2774191 RepID=UPI00193B5092|nr:hypothetical protein [Cysteiniphilum marinum]